MTKSSLETEDDTALNLRYMHQILEMVLVANTPSDSLDASTLLLSLSEGCDSIAIHFFSAFPIYQIKLLSKFPITDPACLPILDLFINMTSHECFAKSLTSEATDFLLCHAASDNPCPATELVCKILNNLTCNGEIAEQIGQLIPRFLLLLNNNLHEFSGLEYLVCAICNSCTNASPRLVLVNNFPSLIRLLSLSMDVPRVYTFAAALLKNCMFQMEFRDVFVKDGSRLGIKFIIASLLLPGMEPETFANDIPELFPILPHHIHGEQALRSNLEALLLLCTDLSGRTFLRDINMYALLRRVHLLLCEPACMEIINDIVSLLIRDEAQIYDRR
jgi:uncharacterized protein DUF384